MAEGMTAHRNIPLHLLVVLSKIAFVETIFPYLKQKATGRSHKELLFMSKSKEHTYFFFKHLQTLKYKMFFTEGHAMRILNFKLKNGMARLSLWSSVLSLMFSFEEQVLSWQSLGGGQCTVHSIQKKFFFLLLVTLCLWSTTKPNTRPQIY